MSDGNRTREALLTDDEALATHVVYEYRILNHAADQSRPDPALAPHPHATNPSPKPCLAAASAISVSDGDWLWIDRGGCVVDGRPRWSDCVTQAPRRRSAVPPDPRGPRCGVSGRTSPGYPRGVGSPGGYPNAEKPEGALAEASALSGFSDLSRLSPRKVSLPAGSDAVSRQPPSDLGLPPIRQSPRYAAFFTAG